MFLNFKELSHQKVYIAPLQNESISIAVPSKADEYKIHCISCNVQLYSCELEEHKASCSQSSGGHLVNALLLVLPCKRTCTVNAIYFGGVKRDFLSKILDTIESGFEGVNSAYLNAG